MIEPFLDLGSVESTDLTFSPVTPTKVGPLSVGTAGGQDTSDVHAQVDGDGLHLYFARTDALPWEDNGEAVTAVAADGSTFGAVVTIVAGVYADGMPDDFVFSAWAGTSGTHLVDGSMLIQTLALPEFNEGKALLQDRAGRWMAFYNLGHGTDTRRIGVFRSEDSDITGTFENMGIVLPPDDYQQYGIGFHDFGEVYAVFVMRYDEPSEMIHTALYVTRDLYYFTQLEEEWVSNGAAESWDEGLVRGMRSLIEWDAQWRMYYSGAEGLHDDPGLKTSRIGYVHVPVGRLMESSGTGSLITVPRVWGSLSVNADGEVGLELQNVGGGALDGFTLADYDTVDASGAFTPTWNGQPAPNVHSKLSFSVGEGQTLYSYEWEPGSAESCSFSSGFSSGFAISCGDAPDNGRIARSPRYGLTRMARR